MTKSKTDIPIAKDLKVYEALIAAHPGIERKGKKNPYTPMNGNMFSFLAADGSICIRLSETDSMAFAGAYDAPPVVQYGAVMKEYIAVPDMLLADSEALTAYFEKSVTFARSLKPKPTKRK